MQISVIKGLMKVIFIYLVMVFLFTMSMIVVCFIPRYLVSDNIEASGIILEEEGYFPNYTNCELFKFDNFTDILMLNGMYVEDSDKPIASAMLNTVLLNKKIYNLPAIPDNSFFNDKKETYNQYMYGRYWHGYEVIQKPLFLLLTIRGIRVANYLVLGLLLGMVSYLLYQKVNSAVSISFLISVLMVGGILIPRSLQYSSMFYVSLIFMALVLYFKRLTSNLTNTINTFFVIGGITVFIDYLTTPQLTLCLPLICCLMVYTKNNPCSYVMAAMTSWMAGYVSLWVSKWIIGYGLLNVNLIADALTHAEERVSVVYDGASWTFKYMLISLWSYLGSIEYQIVFCLIILLLMTFLIYSLYNIQLRHRIIANKWLLLIFLFVPVWFIILRNHTIEHFYFTWRALLVQIWIILIIISKSVSFHFKHNEE